MERKQSSSNCMFCQKLTASKGGMRNVCKVLVRSCEGKRSLGRCRRRKEDNIKMVLKNVGLAQAMEQ
jgi:hypothetical protein